MIKFSEIYPGDLIKVLVNVDDDEDIEDEMYAKVIDNRDDYLIVSYYSETPRMYKGALIHEIEEKEELVQEGNLLEHHLDNDIPVFKCLGENMFALIDDIDDDEESDIIDLSDDDDSDLSGFIVPDDYIDGLVLPPEDHKTIDENWNEWLPSSPGAKKYKEMVDNIEVFAKQHASNLNF